MTKSLLALAQQGDSVMKDLIEQDGEITVTQELALEALAKEVDACQAVLVGFDAYEARFQAQVDLLRLHVEKIKRAREAFKGYLATCVKTSLSETLEGEFFVLALQPNPSAVIVEDEAAVPPEYKSQKIEIKVDKKRVAEDLKLGIPVQGCKLERTQRLVVKPRSGARKAIT